MKYTNVLPVAVEAFYLASAWLACFNGALGRRVEHALTGLRQIGHGDRPRRSPVFFFFGCSTRRRTRSRATCRNRHRPAPAAVCGSSANRPGISVAHGYGRRGRTRGAPCPSRRMLLALHPAHFFFDRGVDQHALDLGLFGGGADERGVGFGGQVFGLTCFRSAATRLMAEIFSRSVLLSR